MTPGLAVISSAMAGSPFVPSVVTAPFTSSLVTLSPSNTTTGFDVELTTLTGTLIVSSPTTLPLSSLYNTFTGTVSLSPFESVFGNV